MSDFYDEPDFEAEDENEPDYEPDLDFGFEHDSAMTSVGWGTDEDYGFYGEDDFGGDY